MPRARLRRHLSMPGLLATVRTVFGTDPESINPRGFCPACGLVVFTLKFPSFIQFDAAIRNGEEPAQLTILKSPFKVRAVPQDTCMRDRHGPAAVRNLWGCSATVWPS